jgi:hypothetical protein
MGITIVNYIDTDLVNRINEQALLREQQATVQSFSDVLNDATEAYSAATPTVCPSSLDPIFTQAADTYGVSSNLLKSIARAESNFNTSAVSSAGACGVMQLMPSTAATLGVTDIYDPTQNIMGGAKYIAQLLNKYSGNTTLALAAYNAGSAAVDTYGGIPPYTETQNYVSKVLSYLNGTFEVDYSDAGTTSTTVDSSLSADGVSTADDTAADSTDTTTNTFSVTVQQGIDWDNVTGADVDASASVIDDAEVASVSAAADVDASASDTDDTAMVAASLDDADDPELAKAQAKELINQIIELQSSNPQALDLLVTLLSQVNS